VVSCFTSAVEDIEVLVEVWEIGKGRFYLSKLIALGDWKCLPSLLVQYRFQVLCYFRLKIFDVARE
jgi:hypothetical protein